MGMISNVISAIDDRKIREYIDLTIDEGYIYSSDWEVEMAQANTYLHTLLQNKIAERPKKLTPEEIRRARCALASVSEDRVSEWISGLKRDYFPALSKLW